MNLFGVLDKFQLGLSTLFVKDLVFLLVLCTNHRDEREKGSVKSVKGLNSGF